MKKISVVIAGRHSTSICLEEEFWRELKRIALVKHKSINAITYDNIKYFAYCFTLYI